MTAPLRVYTRLASPQIAVVNDVIVDQTGHVDYLGNECDATLRVQKQAFSQRFVHGEQIRARVRIRIRQRMHMHVESSRYRAYYEWSYGFARAVKIVVAYFFELGPIRHEHGANVGMHVLQVFFDQNRGRVKVSTSVSFQHGRI